MPSSAQNLAALKRELRRLEGRRNPLYEGSYALRWFNTLNLLLLQKGYFMDGSVVDKPSREGSLLVDADLLGASKSLMPYAHVSLDDKHIFGITYVDGSGEYDIDLSSYGPVEGARVVFQRLLTDLGDS